MRDWIYASIATLLVSLPVCGKDACAGDIGTSGSVTYAFDGGTLRCTFGTSKAGEKPHVAIIVYPNATRLMNATFETPLKISSRQSLVLVSKDGGRLRQLTSKDANAWARNRVTEMASRKRSIAENSFVAAVVHTLTADQPLLVWGSEAEEALESGDWSMLFHKQAGRPTQDPFEGDPFEGDPVEGDPVEGDPFLRNQR